MTALAILLVAWMFHDEVESIAKSLKDIAFELSDLKHMYHNRNN